MPADRIGERNALDEPPGHHTSAGVNQFLLLYRLDPRPVSNLFRSDRGAEEGCVAVLVSLLVARARRAGLRRLAVAAALGLATALAVVSAAVTAVTAESTLTTAVAALPAGERSVVVSSYGLPTPQRVDELDALVAARLPQLGSGPLRRQLVHREVGDTHGNSVVVAAPDDLASAARLVAGRLPASCTPRRCEVVLVLPDRLDPGAATPQPPSLDPALGLVVVGTVRRSDPLLLSG